MTFPPLGNEADLAMKEEYAMSERLRGCPETKALKNNILCHDLGKTKNGITGWAVSCHAFSKV